MTGTIPQSDALAEVEPESLSELFARDPEGYTQQDLDRVIQVLREQRKRWEAAGSVAPGKPAPKAGGKRQPLSLIAGEGITSAVLDE